MLIGRCWEAGGAPAYWPWTQALRGYVREARRRRGCASSSAPARADLVQILPDLRELLPDLREASLLDPEGARFRLFDATGEFLRRAAAGRPIVLVLDDLHAADDPSLLLLRYLARELGASRLLLLCAYRDVAPVPGERLAQIASPRSPASRSPPGCALGGLSEPRSSAYVERTAAEMTQLAAALHAKTDGNPLFVGEIVRLFSVESEPQLAIPPSARDAIARRLTYVSQECNRLLILASVLGREFALDALARLGGVADDQLLDTLDEAIARPHRDRRPRRPGPPPLRPRPDPRHALREPAERTPREAAPRRPSRRWNGSPSPRSQSSLTTHSPAATSSPASATPGGPAIGRSSCTPTRRRRACTALALQAADREPGLLLALGDALTRAGSVADARATFLSAADLAREARLPDLLARAALGYGGGSGWHRAGDDDRLVPLLEEALQTLGDDAAPLRARLLARLAGALRDQPSLEPRASLSRRGRRDRPPDR